MKKDILLLPTVPPGTRRVQAAIQVTKRECSYMQKSYGWAHKWDSPTFLQQKLFKQRTSGRINRNRKKFAMAQVLWQPHPNANTCVKSKAAQLLRTQTSSLWGFISATNYSLGPTQAQSLDVEALTLQKSALSLKDKLCEPAWDLPEDPSLTHGHSPTGDVLWVLSLKFTIPWCHTQVWILESHL